MMLEGKKYYNKFQEHDFLRDWNFAHFFPCYIAPKKRARNSNSVRNRVLEKCSNIFFTLMNRLITVPELALKMYQKKHH